MLQFLLGIVSPKLSSLATSAIIAGCAALVRDGIVSHADGQTLGAAACGLAIVLIKVGGNSVPVIMAKAAALKDVEVHSTSLQKVQSAKSIADALPTKASIKFSPEGHSQGNL